MANTPAIVELQRQALIEDVAATLPWAHTEWIKRLRVSNKPDDWRKYMEFAAGVTEPAQKANPNAGLAVFNFTFHNGAMQATVVTPPAAELPPVEEVPELALDITVPPPHPVDEEVVANDLRVLDELLGEQGLT